VVKIAIATPAHGETFYSPYVQSLYRLVRAFERRKWDSTFASVAYFDVAESRNFLLTHWYDKTDATHLLFLDADMGFDPQLVVDMVEFNKPVVGAIYPKRQLDLERVTSAAAAGMPAKRAIAKGQDFIIRGKPRGARNGFVMVDGVGAGVLLLQRACVDTFIQKMPELVDGNAGKTSPLAKGLGRLIRTFEFLTIDGARLSEDYSFCHRWRQCGGEIWANTAYEMTHIGLFRFKGRYADAQTGPRISVQNAPTVVTGRIDLPGSGGSGQAAEPARLVVERKAAAPAAQAAQPAPKPKRR
jgi:hypothetical protein